MELGSLGQFEAYVFLHYLLDVPVCAFRSEHFERAYFAL